MYATKFTIILHEQTETSKGAAYSRECTLPLRRGRPPIALLSAGVKAVPVFRVHPGGSICWQNKA